MALTTFKVWLWYQCADDKLIVWTAQSVNVLLMIAVSKGDRIAQLILERIITPEVEAVQELSSTVRGSGGYGSTGTGASVA